MFANIWGIEGLDKRKPLFYQDAVREAKKDAKREISVNCIKAGVDFSIIRQYTGIGMRTLLRMKKEALAVIPAS